MNYFASGKLLLFGEYLVLKGSGCLAIPLKYGQKMQVENSDQNNFNWVSKIDEKVWFSCAFSKDLEIIETPDFVKADTLMTLLKIIKEEKPSLFQTGQNFQTQLDFPLEWGWGSSSTLISLLSQWSKIDPYLLLKSSLGGSGYDIACATANTPIIYDMESHETIPVYLFPKITSKLLFVYSGKKQISEKEVKQFSPLKISTDKVEKMKSIIILAAKATQIDVFEDATEESENLLSPILNSPTLKEKYFADYPFAIKSLGAWGGDFFMATFRKENDARSYFAGKGYSVLFNYNEIIKK
ncbi:MAG: GYDIA family GHMP kinase [Ginsengibacter sp.]